MKNAKDHCLMNPQEVTFLKQICDHRMAIEIGSFRGGSAEIMAPRVRHLVCIDEHKIDCDVEWYKGNNINPEDIRKEFLKTIEPFDNITYIQKNSDIAYGFLRNKGFKWDFLLIDGGHTYQQCFKDLEHYVPLLQVNKSIVLIHDYCKYFGGVIAACQNYFQRLPNELIETLAVYHV